MAAIALLCIPQTGLKQLPQLYTWTYSIIILAAVANAVTAVFCLVGHFTFYKLQKEVYVNRLPRVLRGSWHTYVGLELQLILSFAMALLEAFITVRWFDFPACHLMNNPGHIDIFYVRIGHIFSIPEDRHMITDLHNLLQPVRNIDDGNS